MARVLILGGGFAAVVAAESLAKRLGPHHQITVVSRNRNFVFYPALVRLAFGKSEPSDISFELRSALLDRRVQLIEAEIARINCRERSVTILSAEFRGELHYDFVVLATGRRLATERITGFFEYADHLLTVDAALKFGKKIKTFHRGRTVIGHCPEARLPIPLFETAIALSRLHEKGECNRRAITIVSNETIDQMFGGAHLFGRIHDILRLRGIEFISDFEITSVTPESVIALDGRRLDCGLRMLIPPFCGPGPILGPGIIDSEGYVMVDKQMSVQGADQTYAAGDCVSLPGPKMGHMAIRQAAVAADNIVAELEGREPASTYDHEMMLVIEAGKESIFAKKDLWSDEPGKIQQGRFWGWAKRLQEQHWKTRHTWARAN